MLWLTVLGVFFLGLRNPAADCVLLSATGRTICCGFSVCKRVCRTPGRFCGDDGDCDWLLSSCGVRSCLVSDRSCLLAGFTAAAQPNAGFASCYRFRLMFKSWGGFEAVSQPSGEQAPSPKMVNSYEIFGAEDQKIAAFGSSYAGRGAEMTKPRINGALALKNVAVYGRYPEPSGLVFWFSECEPREQPRLLPTQGS